MWIRIDRVCIALLLLGHITLMMKPMVTEAAPTGAATATSTTELPTKIGKETPSPTTKKDAPVTTTTVKPSPTTTPTSTTTIGHKTDKVAVFFKWTFFTVVGIVALVSLYLVVLKIRRNHCGNQYNRLRNEGRLAMGEFNASSQSLIMNIPN